jgi:hypothetical protein
VYVAGSVNFFDAPTRLFGLRGFAASVDSERSLFGSESWETWIFGPLTANNARVTQPIQQQSRQMGQNKLDALTELFTTGAWLPPALSPAS